MRIVKSIPAENRFFEEYEVTNSNVSVETEGNIVNIYDDVKRQQVLGFGGALTEASAYNYSLLDDEGKKAFIEAYFSDSNGIGYNFGRLHISSCDFAIDIYSNVDEGDKTLESFNIERDKKYIIPFVKDVLNATGEELVLFASPWSPPAYMKDNGNRIGGGKLLDEYKELWALYYVKFIKAYRNEGINISAITVQNEPKAIQTWESCEFTAEDERDFIEKYLAPVLDKEGLSNIKIIIWDHNKERVYDRARTILANPAVNERVWAVGHHWYTGDHFEGLRLVEEQLRKPNLCTEFCSSFGMEKDINVLAEKYGIEICENINNYCIGICDWNVFLDESGGPYHNRDREGTTAIALEYTESDAGCYSPIMIDSTEKKFELTPIYYYVGHFSKFVRRNAYCIATTKYTKELYACAFINPDGERVAVVINTADTDKTVVLRYHGECTEITLEPHSIITAII